MKKSLSYICLLGFGLSVAQAQNKDSLQSEQIDVVRAFEPTVTLVNKVGFPPNLPKISADQPIPQQYKFSDYYNSPTYKPEDLRPLKFNAPSENLQSLGYVRAGFGNYLTPVFNFALANKNQQKYKVGMVSDFIFSKAKNPRFQEYYEFNVKGYGAYHLENTTIGIEAGLRRDQYHLYGYDDSLSESITKEEISRGYTTPNFKLYFFNHIPTKIDLNYKGSFEVDIANTDFNAKASNVGFDVSGDKSFSDGQYNAELNVKGQLASYNFEGSNSRFGLQITPLAGIKKGIWSLKAGPAFIIDDGNVFLLPQIKNQVKIKENQLVMYNEWNSQLMYNNLISAYRINPFLAPNIAYSNFRLQERTFLGFRGAMASGFSYDARFSQIVWNDAPLWVNDVTDFKQFKQEKTKKVSAWNPHVEIGYKKSGLFDAKAAFDYFILSSSGTEAWHMPSLKGLLAGNYYFKDKLQVGVDVIVEGGIKVRNEQLAVEKLSPQVDINFHANYILNKNIAFFAELNNLANNRNQRWYRYDRFGMHGIAGVKVVF